MSKRLAALIYQEIFYRTTLLLNSVTKPLGYIVPWDKNIFYQCFLLV